MSQASDINPYPKRAPSTNKCKWLSYEPENEVARKLYASCGFVENGEMDGDEIVAVIKL